MRLIHASIAATLLMAAVTVATAQNLDGTPYRPGIDPDIDMYMRSWKESLPRHTHGTLIERDILMRGDHMEPPARGAVLEHVKRFTHGTLPPGNITAPTTLDGEQEIFYILSGTGTVTAAGTASPLSAGSCFLAPEGLEFTLAAGDGEPLTMYIVTEPTYDGFEPKREIVVKSEPDFPYSPVIGHWTYMEKDLILGHDGLAILHAVITLTMDPMTIGHPHKHVAGFEEVWTVISGENIAWLGTEIRNQPPGMAYMIPPNDHTNHANINQSKTDQLKLLYFSVRQDR